MSLQQSCKCLKHGRPLEGSIKEEGMVMKQNKHQLEHLPILLVQQLRLQWYKDCRGGNAAAQRNQYPRAMAAERLLLVLFLWPAYTLCIDLTEAQWISDR